MLADHLHCAPACCHLTSPGGCVIAWQGALRKLQALYAIVCCSGSNEMALVDLKRRLGETVQFERCASPCCLHSWQLASVAD